MKNRPSLLWTAIGLWVSGMMIGANLIELMPLSPSWPPEVLLGIGLVIGITSLLQIHKASSPPSGSQQQP